MCARELSSFTPSVMTCGCCSRRSVSRPRPALRSSTSARCISNPSGYGTSPSRRTSSGRPIPSHAGRVELLEPLLDAGHELVGNGTVDQPVIEPERQVPHRPYRNRIVDDDGALLDRAHAEDRNLRLVDDGEAELRAKTARVRDGEGT